MPLTITSDGDAICFMAKVIPGSSRTRITGLWQSMLKVNVASVAEKDKANKELIRHLADILDVSRSSITITSGRHDKRKHLRVDGITEAELAGKLQPYI
jgi:uncharacterized protein